MPKTREIKLRLTEIDHQQLTQQARSLGMPLAVYILSAALEKLHQTTPPTASPQIAPEAAPTTTKRTIKTGYHTTVSNATHAQISASLTSITRTELEERLAANLPPLKAHIVPAQLKKLPVKSLIKYTSERDPNGDAWIPTNQERTLWQKATT